MSQNHFDLIIVGGGMVGLATAAALVESDLSIAIVESQPLDIAKASLLLNTLEIAPQDYQIRVSAISPINQQFLSKLGAWQKLPNNRVANYEKMTVWDGEGSGEITFNAAQLSQPHLGSIVENSAIQAALLQSLSRANHIQIFDQTTIESIHVDSKKTELNLVNDTQLSCQLLVGADGANSFVRKNLNIGCAEQPYNQLAFVATVETELSHNNTAWQRFTQYGPLAFLPLPKKNLCSIVWTLDNSKAQTISQLSSDDFAKELTKAFEYRLGKVKMHSEFRGFPLIKRHADSYLKSRVVLLGDAAHTIHPLAGQGVNLGFQDAACFSKNLIKIIKNKRDFSLIENLRQFERERKFHNKITQDSMSGFKYLFGNNNLPLTLIRNFGLTAFDKNQLIKTEIAKIAMGV